MIKAVIFDKDGTLVDSEEWHLQAMRVIARRYKIELTEEDVFAVTGRTARDGFQYLKETYADEIDPDREAVQKDKLYQKLVRGRDMLVPGARQAVERVSSLLLGLATGSRRELIPIDLGDMVRYFRSVVTADDVVHGKPHPETYTKSAANLGVQPSECVAVEDSTNGIRSAIAAGCKVIAVATADRSVHLYEADHFVRGLDEITLDLVMKR